MMTNDKDRAIIDDLLLPNPLLLHETMTEEEEEEDAMISVSPTNGNISISNDQVSCLLERMMTLGYFHQDHQNEYNEESGFDPVLESFMEENNILIQNLDDYNEGNDIDDNDDDDESDIETCIQLIREQKKTLLQRKKFDCDEDCKVIFPLEETTAKATGLDTNDDDIHNNDKNQTSFCCCMTREYVRMELFTKARILQRSSLMALCNEMNISLLNGKQATFLRHDVNATTSTKQSSQSSQSSHHAAVVAANDNDDIMHGIHYIQETNELITDEYLNDILQSKVVPELKEHGTVSISDLSLTLFRLPLVFVLSGIEQRIPSSSSSEGGGDDLLVDDDVRNGISWHFESDVKLVSIDGVKQLITESYETMKNDQVKNLLLEAVEPIKLKDVIREFHWDGDLIFHHIQHLCDSNQLQGELHTDSINQHVNGAIFIPNKYGQNQRNTIQDFLNSNGFVTIDQAKKVGLSYKKLKEIVFDCCPDIMVFQHCLIRPDVIITSIEVAIEDCVQLDSFVNLSLHLSSDILCYQDDVRSIINDHILEKLQLDGCLIANSKHAVYFSQAMINNISNEIIPPLIEIFAKGRGEQIVNEIDQIDEEIIVGYGLRDENKSSKYHRKSKGKMKQSKEPCLDIGVISLQTVVDAIVEKYSNIDDIQEHYVVSIGDPQWDVNEDEEEDDGPLYTFCRIALNKDSNMHELCSKAIKVYVRELTKIQQGTTLSDRGQDATKYMNKDEGFEQNFPTACHFLQITVKGVKTFDQQLPKKDLERLESELLNHCACFARRVTEYCLFKSGFDAHDVFYFGEGDDDDQDLFASSVDITQQYFKRVFLSCPFDKSGKWQDPIRVLKNVLSGSIGQSVAQMWELVGNQYYDIGDESENQTIGDYNKFLVHAEEFCLTMVGIPFKLLDKKNEKKILARRKKELIFHLQDSTDPREILQLVIVMLIQQKRNVAVFGRNLSGNILSTMLCHKKIPSESSSKIQEASFFINNNDEESVPLSVLDELKTLI